VPRSRGHSSEWECPVAATGGRGWRSVGWWRRRGIKIPRLVSSKIAVPPLHSRGPFVPGQSRLEARRPRSGGHGCSRLPPRDGPPTFRSRTGPDSGSCRARPSPPELGIDASLLLEGLVDLGIPAPSPQDVAQIPAFDRLAGQSKTRRLGADIRVAGRPSAGALHLLYPFEHFRKGDVGEGGEEGVRFELAAGQARGGEAGQKAGEGSWIGQGLGQVRGHPAQA